MQRWRYAMRNGQFGVDLWFLLPGSATPWHAHVVRDGVLYTHTSQVIRGRARLEVQDDTVPDGGIYYQTLDEFPTNFDGMQPHRIVARWPNTIVFNKLEPTPADFLERLAREGDWHASDRKG